jgi:hypothetical protein
MKKKIIVFNLLFLICELVGLGIIALGGNKSLFEYYTVDSNLFALIITVVYLYFVCANKKINKAIYLLRLMSLVSLMITFLVVLFILTFMVPLPFLFWGFYGSNLILHVICPLLLLCIYFKYDEKVKVNKLELIYNMVPTLIYAIILIILNIKGIVDGPYPFLRFNLQPLYQSILWFVLIVGVTYPIGYILNKIKK